MTPIPSPEQHSRMDNLIARYRSFVRDKYDCGEIVPWWKGHVVDDYCSRRVRVAPLGFNVVFGLLYEFWYMLRCFRMSSRRFIREQYKLREKP